MSLGGGVAPSVQETLEFPAAVALVASHAAGPLGAARVRARVPATDAAAIRAALAQVAELAAYLLTDDALRAEPVPDIAPSLELLAVPGSALEGAALAALADALAGGVQHGYRRLYLDDGAAMVDLLEALGTGPAATVLAAAGRDEPPPRPQQPEGLSERELEVLRLLVTELTGPEIAQRLYVSLNTLRTHTKHIFTKLDVTTRRAAVRRATERGLL